MPRILEHLQQYDAFSALAADRIMRLVPRDELMGKTIISALGSEDTDEQAAAWQILANLGQGL